MTIILLIIALFSFYMIAHIFLALFYFRFMSLFAKQSPPLPSKISKLSLIIPAFNEELKIISKIENTRASVEQIDIPYEVLIGTDGSEDNTPKLVEDYISSNKLTNWKVIKFNNEGKCQTINKLVNLADGDVIISTDADTAMADSAIQHVIEIFEKDDSIGCLSCVPVFRGNNLKLQSLYWDFEIRLRDAESRLGKLVVLTGWVYAYRKHLFREIPSTAMADDFWIPLTILLQGYKSIQSKTIKGLSEKTDEQTEVRRRKRVIAGGIDIVKKLLPELSRQPSLLLILFSHKIIRWLLPVWIITFMLSSTLLNFNFFYLYLSVMVISIAYLKPRNFIFLVYSVLSPVFSFVTSTKSSDLSKWNHTRKQ